MLTKMYKKIDFEVKVKKNELVKAALPVQEHWLPQSNLDLLLPPLDPATFFCYKKPTSITTVSFEAMVSTLKKALSKILVSFYPLAGEMVENNAGEPEIHCNNIGVNFIEAYADVELKDLNFYSPDETIGKKLVPYKKKQAMLAIQATQLKCGGVVVACTFDHRTTDAFSAQMFFVSLAELAQSRTLSQAPSFARSLLFPRLCRHYSPSLENMYVPISKLPQIPQTQEVPISMLPQIPQTQEMSATRIYCVTTDQLDQLQSLAAFSATTQPCKKTTKLEAFCAYLWKTIANGYDSNKVCRLGIVVDGRRRLRNELATYYGNVLSIPFGEKKIIDLKAMPLSEVAKEVRQFLNNAVNREHFVELIDFVEAHRPEPLVCKVYTTRIEEGPAFVVSSGQHFPTGKVDFGWGQPAFLSHHFNWGGQAGYVVPFPSPTGNGDWIVYMHMLAKQLDFIEVTAGQVFKPLTSNYLNLI